MLKRTDQNGIFFVTDIPSEKSIRPTIHNKFVLNDLLCNFCGFVLLIVLVLGNLSYAEEQSVFPFDVSSPEILRNEIQLVTATDSNTVDTKPVTEASTEALEIVKLYEHTKNKNRVPVISCLDIDRTGKLLAVGGDDHKVRFWDVEKRRFVMQVHDHLDWVRDIAFNFDHSKIVTIAHDGQIQIWNVQNGNLIMSVKEKVYGLQSVAFNVDGTKIAVCGFDKFVRIYDANNGNLIAKLETNETGNRSVIFSTNGSQLAVAGRSGIVRIWSMADLSKYNDIKGSRRRINAMTFSPDGSKLAVGGDGPFITILNPQTGTRIKRLPEHAGKTFSLVFCNDNVIASGESDNAIRIWDIAQGKQITTLVGHTGTVVTMVFDAEKQLLISGGFDTSIRFWNIADKNGVGNETQTGIDNFTKSPNPSDKMLQLYPLPDENIPVETGTPKVAARESGEQE
ncbi:MAG: WD40 repeat domain-containing protein [Planctomycetaceae bacterium]|jgi:WD40 repeat protein|nr:WD40 repeat domain-containing protein [Planctomycetaceae bacterium]